jgi:glycosyltransferase involved in cell wall biosynthesis
MGLMTGPGVDLSGRLGERRAMGHPNGRPGRRQVSPPDAAILLPHLRVGGAELSMLRLARGLAGQGRRVDVVALHCDGPLTAMLGGGVRGVDLAGRSTTRALPQLVRYLHRERPGALISAQPHLNLAAVVAARLAGGAGTAVILTEHAPPSLERAFYGGWRYCALRLLAPYLYPAADRVVGVSRGICEELQALLPGTAIDLVYNPVVPDDVAELARQPAPHPWLGDGGAPVVMGVGRLAPEKDFPSLVRAVARIAPIRPIRLMILGEGPDRPQIADAAGELGLQLSMPGRVDNVFAYLSRASVFVLSSLFEGFGNVAVEALACGTPVVATDCPVGPREILEGGRFGRLVPPGDISAMALAIEAALGSRATPPGLALHVRKFTVAASVERYASMIEAAASARVASATTRRVPG